MICTVPAVVGVHVGEGLEQVVQVALGGCCGSTPDHIAAMARAVEGPTSDNLDCEKPCPAIVAAQPWLDKAKTVLEAATPRDHLALALAYRELGGNLYAQGKRVEGDALTDRMLDTLVAGLPDTYARLRRPMTLGVRAAVEIV